MAITIQTIHCSIDEDTRKILEEKVEKLNFAESLLVNADFVITQEHNQFILESKLHFRGNVSLIIKESGYNVRNTFDALMHKVLEKVRREKSKRQDK